MQTGNNQNQAKCTSTYRSMGFKKNNFSQSNSTGTILNMENKTRLQINATPVACWYLLTVENNIKKCTPIGSGRKTLTDFLNKSNILATTPR